MRALVVYESMYGNTHRVADAVGRGLAGTAEVAVVPVGQAGRELVDAVDLIVVGGPTHAHGMTRASTRRAAIEQAGEPGSGLAVDPDATGPGLRDWFASLDRMPALAAAFDTRVRAPAALTGRASKGIAKALREHGAQVVAEPESFLVGKESALDPAVEARAEAWGRRLAEEMVGRPRSSSTPTSRSSPPTSSDRRHRASSTPSSPW